MKIFGMIERAAPSRNDPRDFLLKSCPRLYDFVTAYANWHWEFLEGGALRCDIYEAEVMRQYMKAFDAIKAAEACGPPPHIPGEAGPA
jgi:hypothetical protein